MDTQAPSLVLLTEREMPSQVRALVGNRDNVRLAVAFWGRDAIALLGLDKARGGKVLCNLQSGCCDPDAVKKLMKTYEVKAHPKLHAKLYMCGDQAIVGSSNASSNGLVDDVVDTRGWRELNVRTRDPAMVAQLNSWFDERWEEADDVTPAMLRKVGSFGGLKPPKSGSLLAAVRSRPMYFSALPIYFTLYKSFIDKATREKIARKAKKISVGKIGTDIVQPTATIRGASRTVLEKLLGRYWEYLDWDIPQDAWLIDISCVRTPRVWGISQSYSRIPAIPVNGSTAYLSFRRPRIVVNDIAFQVTQQDRLILKQHFDELWNHPSAKGNESGKVLHLAAAANILRA